MQALVFSTPLFYKCLMRPVQSARALRAIADEPRRPASTSLGGEMSEISTMKEGKARPSGAEARRRPGAAWRLVAALAIGLIATVGISFWRLRSVAGIPDVGD